LIIVKWNGNSANDVNVGEGGVTEVIFTSNKLRNSNEIPSEANTSPVSPFPD